MERQIIFSNAALQAELLSQGRELFLGPAPQSLSLVAVQGDVGHAFQAYALRAVMTATE